MPYVFLFSNDTATTEIYTLSLHDALPIWFARRSSATVGNFWVDLTRTTLYILLPLSFVLALILISQGVVQTFSPYAKARSEEHTSELQSHSDLVCRLLLEKKNNEVNA